MKKQKLLKLDKQGLIPGPNEPEDEFEKRAEYCLTLKKNLQEQLKDKIPFSPLELMNLPVKSAFFQTERLYGIKPDWVPVFFSNAQLPFWHGGCAWIFRLDENSPVSGLLQLRKHFYTSEKYLSFYHRDEILAHEFSHIGRMCFNEPKFEEFLAYQSSQSPLRRWFGPIVQSARESLLFIAILLLIFLLDGFMLWFGDLFAYYKLMWLKLVPLLLLGIGIFRLIARNRQFSKCRKNLLKINSNPLTVNSIIYRLTDKEIIAFGKMDQKTIINYIKNQEEKGSLRWQLITSGYLYAETDF